MFFSLSSNAQEYSFGVKGGINHGSGPEVTGRSSNVGGIDYYSTDTFHPDSEIGFHGGVFFQLKFGKFFIRPEAMYNTIDMTFSFVNLESKYSVEKFSIPLLFGYNFWGPLDVYAGPAYQNIMSANLEDTQDAIVVQETPLAGQAGIKANFGRFEIDLRYDRQLSIEDPYEINIENDSSPGGARDGVNYAYFQGPIHQVMLSLSFKIGDSESNPGRRRGKGCYF